MLGNFNKAWYKQVKVESTDSENVLNEPLLLKKGEKNTFDCSDRSESEKKGKNIIIYVQYLFHFLKHT